LHSQKRNRKLFLETKEVGSKKREGVRREGGEEIGKLRG